MGPQPWWHIFAAIGGWVLAGTGMALLVWALFWDRARGRRRCPKCWYDMSGAPGTRGADGAEAWKCPECGLEIRSAAKLRRTRRRWRWGLVSAVMLAAAWMVASVPAILAHGWWGAAPRPVLIAMIPWVERDGPRNWQQPPSKLITRMDARLFRGRWALAGLTWPERWMLARVCAATLKGERGDYTKSLAARGLVLASDDPLARADGKGKGHVVIAKSALTYARAWSYSDRGMVKGSIGVRHETPFITAFVRPERRFRFEFLSGHPHERTLSMRYVVWASGGDIRSWWTLRPAEQQFPALSAALAGPTGVSGGSAMNIPSLLLADQLTSRLLFATGVVFAGQEQIDGHPCFRVDVQSTAWPETVWIDAESFLIRRIENRGRFHSITTYEPRIDIELGPEWFQFDPEHPERSPLQDERKPR